MDSNVIKKRGPLLQRYMDHDPLLELQALYALQALVHKLEHPAGKCIYVSSVTLKYNFSSFIFEMVGQQTFGQKMIEMLLV